jgi:hypothetical protein
MATPRKSGAQRGRPAKQFFSDPHRYGLAIALALRQLGVSENAAFALVATVVLGRKVAERNAPARRKRGVGTIPAGRLASYERAWHLNGNTASFKGFRTTLRKKLGRLTDPEALLWLAATSHGIAAFLSTGYLLGGDFEQLLRHVVVCADRATAGTLPVHFLDALTFGSPDLLTKVSAPEEAYSLDASEVIPDA